MSRGTYSSYVMDVHSSNSKNIGRSDNVGQNIIWLPESNLFQNN